MSLATIKDVAAQAGVSPAAVSLYLNGRPGISHATRERIAAAIALLGYVPRVNSRRGGGGQLISFLVENLPLPSHTDHFYSEVIQGIQAEAEHLGYRLVLSPPATHAALPRAVADQHVAGVLAVGGGDITDDLLDHLANEGLPIVLVDNQCDKRPLDSVVADNQHGGYLATRHLLDLGHRRIAIIRGSEQYKSLTERYQGYRQALREAGIPPDDTLIQPSISIGFPLKGYREMRQLLAGADLPTAVFAVSDHTAIGALEAIREHGLRVPDDISLIGFDNIAPGAHEHPPLTSIGTAKYDMGVVAMQRLDALISGHATIPLKLVVYVHLVERASTAPPNSARSHAPGGMSAMGDEL
jgi:LacI family transcriptional regulator